MHKALYSVITKIPIFGSIYKIITSPKFSSMGLSDGEYNYILSLIKNYQEQHPTEQITLKLMKKILNDDKLV